MVFGCLLVLFGGLWSFVDDLYSCVLVLVVCGRLWSLLVLVIRFTNQLQTLLVDLLFSVSYILFQYSSVAYYRAT